MTTPQPPVVPGRHETYTLGEMMPAAPRKKRTGLIVGIAAVVFALAGFGAAGVLILDSDESKPAAAAPTSAAPSPSADAATVVECTNIERAYNAWGGSPSYGPPADTGALYNANELDLRRWMEDGDDFYRSVKGYDSKESKSLVVAVTEYNLSLSIANAQLTISGDLQAEDARKVLDDADKIRSAYGVYRIERGCPAS